VRGRADACEVIAVLGRILDALRVMRRVPQRRIWLLQGVQLHRDVVVPVALALERQPLVGQAGDEDRQRLVEDRTRIGGVDSKVA
jgi:hypothetical protein